MNSSIEIPMIFMGSEFIFQIDYKITTFGEEPYFDVRKGYGDPGCDADFDITEIRLSEYRKGKLGPSFEATGELYYTLIENDQIIDDILIKIHDQDAHYDYEEWLDRKVDERHERAERDAYMQELGGYDD